MPGYPEQWMTRLNALHYKQPPWSTAFDIDTTTIPCAPVKNTVRDNRWCMLKPPAQPPAPSSGCVNCPAGRYGYGDDKNGHWCCSVAVAGNGCPSKNICCLEPGTKKASGWGDDGCEGIHRCGTNPCVSHHCYATSGTVLKSLTGKLFNNESVPRAGETRPRARLPRRRQLSRTTRRSPMLLG